MTKDEQSPDWVEIRKDWECSEKSIRDIARLYGVSDTAVRKRAKADGWPDREAVSKRIRREPKPPREPRKTASRTQMERIEIAGMTSPDPEDIVARGQSLVFRMLDELDAVTTYQSELHDMIENVTDDEREREALRKAINVKSRSEVVKTLALAYKTLSETEKPGSKKEQKQKAAEQAAGKFAPRGGPQLVVKNV